MKKWLKIVVLSVLSLLLLSSQAVSVQASLLNPAIHTISGTTFLDANRNGRYDLGDIPQALMQ